MAQKIFFDLSCFKDDFQEYIFKMANVNNYFEFINQHQNQFSINLQAILKMDDDCTFQNLEDSTEEKEPDILYPYIIENKMIMIKKEATFPKKMNKIFM